MSLPVIRISRRRIVVLKIDVVETLIGITRLPTKSLYPELRLHQESLYPFPHILANTRMIIFPSLSVNYISLQFRI